MSKKYVIEIKSEYEDTIRGIMVLGVRDSNLYMDALAVEDMEELNSDYINEHYGSLQDDAYKRGLEDGKAINDKGCEGCKYECENKTKVPCILCSNNIKLPCVLCANKFKNQWTAKDDKFEFGDEIIDSNGVKGCVVSKDNEGYDTMYALFDGCRVPQYITQKKYRKTGKRYDIEKILEEMKGDSDK